MSRWRRRPGRVLAAVGAVVALVLAFGLYWFAPWKLFVDDRVDEALPPVAIVTMSLGSTPPTATLESVGPTPAPSPTATPSPTAPTAPTAQLLAQGSFISHEHQTSGTVSVVRQPDGSRVLAIADLATSNGPDLRVWLSNAPVASGEKNWYIFDDEQYRHLSLGALKGNLGNQVYTIPAAADLAELTSVTIWCDRFNVSFGAATLQVA
jgi:hypothetical protein